MLQARHGIAVAVVCAAATVGWLLASGERGAPQAADRAVVDAAASDAALAQPDGADERAAGEAPRAARVAAVGAGALESIAPVASPVEAASVALVTGRVVSREGAPIAGARIAALPIAPDVLFGMVEDRPRREWAAPLVGGDALNGWADAVWSESGADGRFELRGLAPGVAALAVRASGWAPLDRPWIGVPVGSSDVGEVALGVGVRVEGRVVDAAGAPVVGARVAVRLGDALRAGAPMRRFAPAGTSGPGGAFALDGVPPGELELEAATDALGTGTFEGMAERAPLHDVLIALPPPRRIAGRVVLPDGVVVPPLVVHAAPDARRRGRDVDESERRSALPDADGAFAFEALAKDGDWRLTVRLEGSGRTDAAANLASELVAVGSEGVELGIRPPIQVRVRALDASSGAPVPSLELATRRSLTRSRAHAVDGAHVAEMWLSELSPGATILLELHAPGYHEHAVRGRASSGEIDLGEVRLRPQAALALRVVDDATGAPVAGASAGIAHEQGRNGPLPGSTPPLDWSVLPASAAPVTTDVDGRAMLVRIEERAADLWVEADGYARLEQTLGEHLAEPLEVRLGAVERALVQVVARGRGLAGVPVRVDRVPGASGVEVELHGPAARRLFVTDAAGEARVPALRGERYSLSVPRAIDGSRALVSSVERFTRDGDRWVLDLGDVATLEGRVTRHGEPLAGARVVAHVTGGNEWLGAAATAMDGTYELTALPAGALVGFVEHRDLAFAADWRAELAPGANRLDVDVAPTALTGTLVDDLGTAVAGRDVRLVAPPSPEGGSWQWKARRTPSVTTDGEGRFRFEDLAPDTPLELSIEDRSHVMPDAFVLEPGEERDAGRIVTPRSAVIVLRFPRDAAESIGPFVRVRAQHARGERILHAQRGVDLHIDGLPPGRCTVRLEHFKDGKTLAVHEGLELAPRGTRELVVGGS